MIASSILGISKTGLLVIALVAALALNVATLTIDSAFKMMSSAIGAVAGLMTSKPATVLDKHRREITSWKNKVHVQKNYSAALRNQISAAEKHMDLLDNQNTKLQRKLKTPATVIFKGKQRLLSEAVQETTQGISRRVATATARSVGSIAAESIPYIGIGAIVGVTALELDDACKTMKDLHALDVAFNPSAANDADATEVCGQRVPTKEEVIAELKQSPAKAWEAAKSFDLPDLPSWDESILAAKRKWQEILSWMKDLLGS